MQRQCRRLRQTKQKEQRILKEKLFELNTIKLGLKASFIWDLTNIIEIQYDKNDDEQDDLVERNCQQVFHKLETMMSTISLNLENSIPPTTANTRSNFVHHIYDNSSLFINNNEIVRSENPINVIEIIVENGNGIIINNITFFGNIFLMIENINSALVELENSRPTPEQTTTNCDCNSLDAENQQEENEFNNNNFTCFIDVSAKLCKPKIIRKKNKEDEFDDDHLFLLQRKNFILHIKDYLVRKVNERYFCIRLKQTSINHIVTTINYNNDNNLNADGISDSDLSTQSGTLQITTSEINLKNCKFDLCFLSGVLLGYPVIYCNEDTDLGNCLSFQTLCNYKVRLTSSSSLSNISSAFNHQTTFELYSFTVPNEFRHLYENKINKWFHNLRDYCKNLKNFPYNLSMETILENYPLILT